MEHVKSVHDLTAAIKQLAVKTCQAVLPWRLNHVIVVELVTSVQVAVVLFHVEGKMREKGKSFSRGEYF